MLIDLRRSAVATAATLMLLSGPTAFAAPVTQVVCDDPLNPLSCEVVIKDDGSGGGAGGSGDGGSTSTDGGSGDGGSTPPAGGGAGAGPLSPPVVGDNTNLPPGECAWKVSTPKPPADDPLWGGADPATNEIIFNDCNGGPTLYGVAPAAAAGGVVAAPLPPPDPAVLAAQAIGQLSIPMPAVNVAPDPERLAVNFWTYLWTDDPGPVSTTVELRGVSVTATAVLSSVDWVMGEPAKGGGPAEVTCTGAGSPPPSNATFLVNGGPPPACGYVYRLRSTAARTGGTERWPVTVTSTWAVTWTSNTGAAGSDELISPSSLALVRVGEYRTVGGFGSGSGG